MTSAPRTRPVAHRRGVALAVAALLLSVATITAVAAIAASADDSSDSALRVQGLRAFYAAESGALLARRQQADTPASPLTGERTLPEGQRFVVIAPFAPTPAPPGTATIEGQCGQGGRRIVVDAP